MVIFPSTTCLPSCPMDVQGGYIGRESPFTSSLMWMWLPDLYFLPFLFFLSKTKHKQIVQEVVFSVISSHWSVGLIAKNCLTLASLWTVACQSPLSMGFPRQEHWSRLPFPSPGDFLHWTWASHITGRFFTIWATREAPKYSHTHHQCKILLFLGRRFK